MQVAGVQEGERASSAPWAPWERWWRRGQGEREGGAAGESSKDANNTRRAASGAPVRTCNRRLGSMRGRLRPSGPVMRAKRRHRAPGPGRTRRTGQHRRSRFRPARGGGFSEQRSGGGRRKANPSGSSRCWRAASHSASELRCSTPLAARLVRASRSQASGGRASPRPAGTRSEQRDRPKAKSAMMSLACAPAASHLKCTSCQGIVAA